MITQHQAKMIGFARQTLRILETHEDWGADTLDDIAVAASCAELAETDENGMFRVRESL